MHCAPREGEAACGLVELLIQITHCITVKAEKRVMEELLAIAVRVRGKSASCSTSRAALDEPDGTARDVIFPVAGPDTFERLVQEAVASRGESNASSHIAVRVSNGS